MTTAATTDATTAATTVSIAIARDPALVRTVRLVTAAVARRAALDEGLIEEVRLAVGEACAVLIGLDAQDGQDASRSRATGETSLPDPSDDHRVRVELSVDRGIGAVVEGRMADSPLEVDGLELTPWALLRGLSEDVTVEELGETTRVRMSWPEA